MDPAGRRGAASGVAQTPQSFRPGGARLLYVPDARMACGPDAPAPSSGPPPHPANRDRRDLPVYEGSKADVRPNHHPETDVVVTVVRFVVVAVVRARVVLIVVPRAPAQHPRLDPGAPGWPYPATTSVAEKNGIAPKKFAALRAVSEQQPSASVISVSVFSVAWETQPPPGNR